MGVLIRLAPLVFTAVWGSDSGEYYFLTKRLLDTHAVSFTYDGWGIAYPFFPGMFLLTGAVVATTGVPLLTAVQVVVPVVAGLIGLGVLLVTHRVTGSRLASVSAGAFAAVTAPNVIVTSHAMPGSLGHVLVIAGLLLALHARDDKRHLWAFPVVAIALLVTHHLSTYFLAGIVAGAAFLRELGEPAWDRRALAVDVPVVLGTTALALAWWLGVADVFRERIVGDALDLDPFVTAAGFVLALLALPALVLARRRWLPRVAWRSGVPSARASVTVAVGVLGGLSAAIIAFMYVGFPGTNITVTPVTLAYALPPALVIALAVIGARATGFTRDGRFLVGWTLAITASLAFAAVTKNTVLFPYRHIDYLMEGVAAVAGVGVLVVAALVARRAPAARARHVTWSVLAVALVVMAAMSYPPREAVGGFEEAITAPEVEAVRWTEDGLPPASTIAADHRVSSLLFGLAGHRATWDYTYWTYHAESWEPVFDELAALDIPSGEGVRVDYVFLSPPIREGVTLVQWENSKPMTDAAWNKFFTDTEHFEHVYADDADDVHVFRVRWENAPPRVS